MAFSLLHLNLRNWGGGINAKNQAALDLFEFMNIRAANGLYPAFKNADAENIEAPVLVAGFTEVENVGQGKTALDAAAAKLIPDCKGFFIPCGQTALQANNDLDKYEYIAIYTGPNFTPAFVGGFLPTYNFNLQFSVWSVTDLPTTQSSIIAAPTLQNVQVDYRGVCFIGGTVGQQKYIFGFCHNMYALNPSTVLMEQLGGTIFNQLNDFDGGYQDYNGAPIIFGGDWNVDPQNRSAMSAIVATTQVKIGTTSTTILAPTTAGNHTYDYWYKRENDQTAYQPDRDNSSFDPYTGNTAFSDHQAIVLLVP